MIYILLSRQRLPKRSIDLGNLTGHASPVLQSHLPLQVNVASLGHSRLTKLPDLLDFGASCGKNDSKSAQILWESNFGGDQPATPRGGDVSGASEKRGLEDCCRDGKVWANLLGLYDGFQTSPKAGGLSD